MSKKFQSDVIRRNNLAAVLRLLAAEQIDFDVVLEDSLLQSC